MQNRRLLALLFAVIVFTVTSTVSLAFAAPSSASSSDDATQVIIQIGFGLGMGVVAALLGWLSATVPWSHRKFAYTIIISTIAALTVISTQFGGSITSSNAIAAILAVLGAGFVGNKAIQIQSRLRPK